MIPAYPSFVKQAPDNRALRKTTTLSVGTMELSTPPMAQEYFEPGVNTKLNRRSKPKTNYILPSDMPTYPLGFVPTNQSPGANGEEPAIIVVPESKPADLMAVFARIAAEEKEFLPKAVIDVGSMVAREFGESMKAKTTENKVNSMIRQGFTEAETTKALEVVREEEAVKEAKLPAKPIPVEEAIQEALGIPTMNQMRVEYGRKPLGRPSGAALQEKYGVLPEELREAREMEKRGKQRSKLMAQGIIPDF